jgi:hypothetical protein
MSRIESLEPSWYLEQASLYERYAKAVSHIPQDDTLLTVGTVIVFNKTYPNEEKVHLYAAIRTIAGWYVTGHQPDVKNSGMTWRALLDMVGLDNLWTINVCRTQTTLRDHIENERQV